MYIHNLRLNEKAFWRRYIPLYNTIIDIKNLCIKFIKFFNQTTFKYLFLILEIDVGIRKKKTVKICKRRNMV